LREKRAPETAPVFRSDETRAPDERDPLIASVWMNAAALPKHKSAETPAAPQTDER
jgi:hypothetical protein